MDYYYEVEIEKLTKRGKMIKENVICKDKEQVKETLDLWEKNIKAFSKHAKIVAACAEAYNIGKFEISDHEGVELLGNQAFNNDGWTTITVNRKLFGWGNQTVNGPFVGFDDLGHPESFRTSLEAKNHGYNKIVELEEIAIKEFFDWNWPTLPVADF